VEVRLVELRRSPPGTLEVRFRPLEPSKGKVDLGPAQLQVRREPCDAL